MPLAQADMLVQIFAWLALAFVFVVGLGALLLAIAFVRDVTQNRHAIRRNYPVIGRLRYLFEYLGKYFRQYFFAMDREELPFNRAERSWVYSSAKGEDNTGAFGSTVDIHRPGAVLFANCPFPNLGEDSSPAGSLTIGPQAGVPYEAPSLINISGMSYGALSQPAVRALSLGAAQAGCWLNTGEGGLADCHLAGGGDVVFQIGTAKYGVRNAAGGLDDDRLREVAAHEQVRMFEVKLSQGAKPGKGGILPAAKVTPEIAAIRGIPEYQSSISPNRHPEIDSVADILDFVGRVREVTGKPTGVKTALGQTGWLDELAAEIHRRGEASAPDFITVDGGEGGTGVAPMSLVDHMALSIHDALPLVTGKLAEHGLRDRIRVIASGKLITPNWVAWALCMGADFVNTARGFMFAIGCIQSMRCNNDTCPTGVTTHNPRLQRGLDPEEKAERVRGYVAGLRREVGVIAHACGVPDARRLQPKHVRQVDATGRAQPFPMTLEEETER